MSSNYHKELKRLKKRLIPWRVENMIHGQLVYEEKDVHEIVSFLEGRLKAVQEAMCDDDKSVYWRYARIEEVFDN